MKVEKKFGGFKKANEIRVQFYPKAFRIEMKVRNLFKSILISLFVLILLSLGHSVVVSQTSELREKVEELKKRISEISKMLEEEKRKREEIGEMKEEITTPTPNLSTEKEKEKEEELERINEMEVEEAKREIILKLKEALDKEKTRREQEVIKRKKIEEEREKLKKEIEGLKEEVFLLTEELDQERVRRKEVEEVKEEVAQLIRELQKERIEMLKKKLDEAESVHKEEVEMLRDDIMRVTKEEEKEVTKPSKELLEVKRKDIYGMNVLIIYRSGTTSYLEVLQNYRESLLVNTQVSSISSDLVEFENLYKYDLIYPDISLIDSKDKYKIAKALKEYVKDGGALFLEEDFCELFPLPFLGLSSVEIVELRNQEFTLPKVPHKFKKLQLLWKLSKVDFDVPKEDRVHYKNLRLLNLKKGAIPGKAISLVNSGRYTLLSINRYGKGWVLWTINRIPFRGRYLSRFDLGYPNPQARDLHFAYATLNYLIRNLWLDFLSKEKYGFSLKKIYGPYGRPGFSWQCHFEDGEGWEYDSMINFIKILREKRKIPSFTVMRGLSKVRTGYRTITYLENVGSDSHPLFIGKERSSFGSIGRRLRMINNEYLNIIQKSSFNSRPSIVDWNGNRVFDLLIGGENGDIYYYKGVYKGRFKRPYALGIDVGENASPFVYDWDSDGRKDLIVGAKDGKIYYFQNVGKERPTFKFKGRLKGIDVRENSSPFVFDWDSDGKEDLIVGAKDGKIYYFQNVGKERTIFKFKGRLRGIDVGENSSPFVCDWDSDGRKDLIVGAKDGKIYYYKNEGEDRKPLFLYTRRIKGKTTDEEEEKVLDACINSAPFVVDWNNDGKKDLIISSIESLRPKYPIDDPYIKKDVLRNIRYALRNYVPIMPHVYFYHGMTREEKKRELTWHKETFKNLGIPWTETFLLMDKCHIYPFIYWTPNPRIDAFKGIFDLQIEFDLPVTYHSHSGHIGRATEYFHLPSTIKALLFACLRRFGIDIETRNLKDIGFSLRKVIRSFNQLRDRYEYNMNTQEQIVKTIINTHSTKVKAKIYKDRLVLIPDISEVPKDKAKEYINTLGIKIEMKDPEKAKGMDTDSKIYYSPKKGVLYVGVDKKTNVYLNKEQKERFHLIRSNVPFSLRESKEGYRIRLGSSSLKEIKLYSKERLTLKSKDVKMKRKGRYYELTHFGKPVDIVLIKGQ